MNFFIGLSFLVYSVSISASDPTGTFPVGGVLDLRESVFDKGSIYSLNGEWEFYWERLLTPENYPVAKKEGQGILVNVPSYFNSYKIDGESLPGMGYGTYSLTILLPENNLSDICFDIPIFDVAFNIYLDGRLVETNGTVGKTREQEDPWYEPSSFCIVHHTDTLHLLIQVSNFHHRRGGFWKSIFIGGEDKVLERLEHRRMYNYSTIGVLFFFIFFFLVFWLFSRRQILMLLFALTVLGILIRAVNTGLYMSNSFANIPWDWQVRMEYFGSFMALIFGVMFLRQLFPARYMNQIVKVNTILFSLASISLFILPVHLFAYAMLVYQPVVLFFLGNFLVLSLIGVFKKKVMDFIFFVSLAFFIYTLINDILVANSAGAIHANYMSQISFLLFVFSVAVLIILQWVRNYNERVQLEASLRFKNKVLSVIAHDLKNPVASVAQFSDLLATKPELIHNQNILNSLQESSQAAVTLLDNLLYWGRSQSEELTVSPSEFDIEKLIQEVSSLYLHMATQKEIKFSTEVSSKITVLADRSLINIVVRNLVSNAIKFTPRKGSVNIMARQEGKLLKFSVVDTGIGINPEILIQFQTQGRLVTTSGTESELGTGLGLQLVKDLVEKNGGRLIIESKPNKGSTFTFTLPISTKEE